MSTMEAEGVNAFRAIGVPDDKASAAAQTLSKRDHTLDIATMKGDIAILKSDVSTLRSNVPSFAISQLQEGKVNPGVGQLNPELLRSLQGDGFVPIGIFEIAGTVFSYNINHPAAGEWLFSIYAWVSVIGEGMVLRIGKSEGPLRIRLAAYKRSLDDVMSGRLGPNEYFKGDTQPWEREGWCAHAASPGAGLIFAKQVTPLATNVSETANLRNCETHMIRDYKPILCGVSGPGRRAKRMWEAKHGPAFPISKRARGGLIELS